LRPFPGLKTVNSKAFDNMTDTMMGLVDGWVWYGSHSVDELDEQIDADFEDGQDFDIERVKAYAATVLRDKRADEADWPPVTDCDRLDRAFDRLRAQGLCVVQFPESGYTMQHGEAAVVAAMNAEDAPPEGYTGCCFYHAQDIDNALNGEGLWLAFGSLESDEDEDDVRVGRLVCEALNHEGLQTEWNGTRRHRIRLPRLRWQRRTPN